MKIVGTLGVHCIAVDMPSITGSDIIAAVEAGLRCENGVPNVHCRANGSTTLL